MAEDAQPRYQQHGAKRRFTNWNINLIWSFLRATTENNVGFCFLILSPKSKKNFIFCYIHFSLPQTSTDSPKVWNNIREPIYLHWET